MADDVDGGDRMLCMQCGSENRDEAKFCLECGQRLTAACPACGAAAHPGQRFCDECGAALEATSSPGIPAQPHAERRLVSVMFADLVGFTPLSEARDPEEVRDLLSGYFELASTTVARYGGTIEKFIGDAVMAVWGVPTAHEDDPERAVRAALDLVAAVRTLGTETATPGLSARAGVLTGEAVANIGATGQGMVAGDLVNTASRLQAAAEPGRVLVGEGTHRAAQQAIAFEGPEILTLKGKAEPVPAWRALRVIAERKGVGRVDGLEPPFVGRDGELRLLKESLHQVGVERKVRLVSLTGVPGIGKSRLVWELRKYVDGLAETVYWHQGRCPSYGDGVTFWALGEMVRMRAGIAESEEGETSRRKLSEAVADYVPDAAERGWVEPRLAHLLGLADAPAGQRDELFSAWRTFFERISELASVVLVFEDLQWADPGLVDFIESVLEWSRNFPILVVTLARPEFADRRPTWGAGQRNFASVHVDPLPAPAMAQLLSGLVRGLPDTLADRILQRAEGIPLYAVEVVRMLIDRGVVAMQDGAGEVVGDLGELDIPATLHALVASRLDALPSEARALLQDAAALGQSFTLDGLAAVTGRDPGALEPSLRDMVRQEFLSLDVDPRSPERGQYGFVQSVIREVSYGTLARRDRRAKHLSAAHYFESLGDDELASVIAAHYVAAYHASGEGPDREAVAARARDGLTQAARRAQSLGSPEQAITFYEQALEVTADGPDRATLLDQLGQSAFWASAYDRGVAWVEESIAYYQRSGDQIAAGHAAFLLMRLLGLGLSRYGEAIERGERALSELPPDRADRVRSELTGMLAFCCVNSGRDDAALQWAEQALVHAEQLDDLELLLTGLSAKATTLFRIGRHREALILSRGCAEVAGAAGDTTMQAVSLTHVSVMVMEDNPLDALATAAQALAAARRAGHRGLESTNLGNIAEEAIWLGEFEQARAALAELEQLPNAGEHEFALRWDRDLLEALTGDPAPVLTRLLAGAAESEASEDVDHKAWYLKVRAMVQLLAGDLDRAHRDAEAGIAAGPRGINAPRTLQVAARAALWLRDPERTRAALNGMQGFRGQWMRLTRLTFGAGVAALEGRREGAALDYQHALAGWQAIGDRMDGALCAADMSLLLPEEAAAWSALDLARATLSDLGAGTLLGRLEQLSVVPAVR